MKMRQRRKQFWWTWAWAKRHVFSRTYTLFDWGVGRIRHQHRDVTK